MAVSSAATVALGIYGCRWRELRPISFGGGARTNNEQAAATDIELGESGEGAGDEEMGFSRGRGRGRGRDGGGEYEMVGLKPEDR
jgi:protein SYS1